MAQLTVISLGKKKGAPPPPPPKGRAAAPPPPPGAADPDADPGQDPDAARQTQDNQPDADDQPLSPAEVGYSEADLCQDCAYMADDGNCSKYHFPVTETGHCEAGYEPKNGGDQQPAGVAVAA